MKRLFSAPTTVNLELTEVCNVKCRHCYNFWRDESVGFVTLDQQKLDKVVEKLAEAEVFHVIVSGGEPFAKFDLLEHVLLRLHERGISTSCNSNLMLATDEKTQRLAAAGLDHILTSLPSPDPGQNDFVMCKEDSLAPILEGIRTCIRNGIRVSVNMVITRANMHQVYQAGKLVAELGCQKLFVTRAVPPTYSDVTKEDDYTLTPEEQKSVLDEALRVKEDFGIMIGSLVSYPLCFLGDLEKYRDFVGRGCPAQSGHRMSINANGDVHACVHEEEAYGNIFESSVGQIYTGRMRKWHDRSFHYEGCAGCPYSDICESGCSMTSLAVYGSHSAKDPLFVGPHVFEKHYESVPDAGILAAIDEGLRFTAPKRLRFRKEDGFHLLNVRWGNSIPVDDDVATFLIEHRDSDRPFTIREFGPERKELLAQLYFKDAIESADYSYADTRDKAGLSFNIDALNPTPAP